MAMTFKGKMATPCVPCISANMWIFVRYLRYCVKSCLNIQQQNVKYKFIYCTMYLFLLGIGSNSWCALYMGRRTFRVSKGNFSGAYYTWVRIIIGKLRYCKYVLHSNSDNDGREVSFKIITTHYFAA